MHTLCTRYLHIGLAAAFALTLSAACREGSAQDPHVKHHFNVRPSDVTAARTVKYSGFHVKSAHLADARPDEAKANLAGARGAAAMADELRGIPSAAGAFSAVPPENAAPHAGHGPNSIDYYPADLEWGLGPVLKTTQHNALYVNYTGTIAQNWGDPEGYLSDLNQSEFIHLTDQYVHSHADGRYPVGADANVTIPISGNTLTEEDVWAILHAAGSIFGTGPQHIYHLFLPKGMDTCLDVSDPGACYAPDGQYSWVFCGYHAAVLFNDIGVVLYTMEPYQNVLGCEEGPPNPNGVLADSTNGTLGHEVFETITDPLGTGWTNQTSDVLLGNEIGDECELITNQFELFTDPVFKLNGKLYQSQLEYSNDGHICTHKPQ